MSKLPRKPAPEAEQAVALEYTGADELPKVVLSGRGAIAQLIVAIAERNGIPVEENEELSHLLRGLERGEEIQREAFQLVAQILSFLYEVDEAWRTQHSFMSTIIEREPSSVVCPSVNDS